MRPTIACLLLVVSLTYGAGTGEPPEAPKDYARLKKLFADRDLIPLQPLARRGGPSRFARWPMAYRNKLALLAAENLEIRPYLKGKEYKDIWDLLRTRRDPEVNRQWGINVVAARILRDLSEHNLISEPKVIPRLIDTLGYPELGQRCEAYTCLYYLTRREVGDDVWGRGIGDEKKEPAYRKWWQQWWQTNKDKHPLYPGEVAAKVRQRVEDIYREIDTKVAPRFDEMSWLKSFSFSPYASGDRRVVGAIDYVPGSLAVLDVPKGKKGPIRFQDLPMLRVEACFQTPSPNGASKEKPFYFGKHKIQMIHREVLPGTDIEIRLWLATPNQTLARALRDRFQGGDKPNK